jgi:TonB-linked SusC/RagA family outer membrane protein
MKYKFTQLFMIGIIWSIPILIFGQERKLTGVVTDDLTGEPLIGANVIIKGTGEGAVTNFDGEYSLSVTDGITLVFSYVGYNSEEVFIQGQEVLDVALSQGEALEEVVVTALGISREKKALGYATQEFQGTELLETRELNVVDALQGKVAGVLINSSSGAPGAGANIVIRGLTSLDPNGQNQPLFVIDGIPISNQTIAGNQLPSSGSNAFNSAEQASFTNRVADLNPADIATMNILKGPAATALYGLRGANGVVVITTKRAQAGKAKVDFSTSFGWEEVATVPEYQTSYREGRFGRLRFNADGTPLRFQAFGPKVYPGQTPVFDPLNDFFQTGFIQEHNLGITGGTSRAQYISSISFSSHDGVIPNSNWQRLSARLGGNLQVSDKIDLFGTITYSNSGGNKPHSGDKSIMSALSYYPTSFDVNDYINPDGSMKDYSNGIIDNPRYLAEFSTLEDDVNRVIGNVGFTYRPLDWLTIEGKVGGDYYNDFRERIVPAGLDVSSQTGGFLIREDINFFEVNTILMAKATHKFTDDLEGTFTLGHNMFTQETSLTNTRGENFAVDNFYDLSNTSILFGSQQETLWRVVGVYGIASLAWKNMLYLDITGRNDWSSSLPQENRSFFYPSASLSWVFTEAIDAGPLSFGKLRASWAKVAKDARPHQIGFTYVGASNFPFDGQNGFTLNSVAGDEGLRPETTTGFEVGAELKFWNDRLGLDVTYFNQTSKDQIIPVPISNSTGISRFVTNAGEIQNKGLEILLTGTPYTNRDFSWDVSLNWSTFEGEVKSIADGIEEIEFFQGGFGAITNKLVPGGNVGDLYGYNFVKDDQGRLIIGEDGFPIVNTTEFVKVGNALPDFTAGLTNTFRWKGLSLSVLLEWREGGDVYDMGLRNSIRNGVLTMTDRRYEEVIFNGVTESGEVNTTPVEINGETLYRSSTRYNRAADVILEDASWFRIRNIRLAYRMPDSWFDRSNFISGATVSITGNNLFLNTPFRGFDPETNYLGSGSNVFGFTGLQTPATRSYFVTLNLSF